MPQHEHPGSGFQSAPPDSLPPAAPWLLWQLADSAFPTGGFAHSGGLEAACQHQAVRGRDDLAAYIRTALQQLASVSLPFVHATFTQSDAFADVDHRCDALLSNHVANRGSRLQGQAFLSTVARAFNEPQLQELRRYVLGLQLPGHSATVFGRVTALLHLTAEAASRLYVFTQLRGWISSAVRLNVIGPIDGQTVQHEVAVDAEQAARQFGAISIQECAQTAPLLDLWQGTQDRLYSRLFQT